MTRTFDVTRSADITVTLNADDLSEADAIGRSRCVVGACHPPTEPVRCVFAADYETTPWRCERLAGHEGAHRSGPVAPSER